MLRLGSTSRRPSHMFISASHHARISIDTSILHYCSPQVVDMKLALNRHKEAAEVAELLLTDATFAEEVPNTRSSLCTAALPAAAFGSARSAVRTAFPMESLCGVQAVSELEAQHSDGGANLISVTALATGFAASSASMFVWCSVSQPSLSVACVGWSWHSHSALSLPRSIPNCMR